jgi:hypothetical protein
VSAAGRCARSRSAAGAGSSPPRSRSRSSSWRPCGSCSPEARSSSPWEDRASTLLGVGLGAERLVLLTEVAAVFRGFGTEDEAPIAELSPGRDAAILAELPAGSMRPKVEAAFAFVEATGGEALITSAEALENGEAGTLVVPAS